MLGLREWRAMGLGWCAALIVTVYMSGPHWSASVAGFVVATVVYILWRDVD